MALLPYAAKSVLRNRRRTISSILGVLLAVVFVAGTFIAIDSSARATLDASLAGIPGDFGLYLNVQDGSTFNYTSVEEALLKSSGVVDVSLYRRLFYEYEGPNSSFRTFPFISTLAINPARRPSMIRDVDVVGSLALPQGSVGITQNVATELDVGIGDSLTAFYRANETSRWEVNLTVAAILEDPAPTSFGGFPGGPFYYDTSFVVIHLQQVAWLEGQLNLTSDYGYTVLGEVWIDRASYVNPYDLEGTTRSLERFQRRLQSILGPIASIQDNILSRLQDFSNRIAIQRVQYLLFSMPVVLLGVYLGAVGVDLAHAERRRELAVMKTRGARRGQLLGLLILEAIVGGLIAAAIGLAAGIGLSRLLLGVVSPTSGTTPASEAFILSTDTILAVAFLSMLLMFGVAYRSAKRTAGLPIIETLRYYAPGETKIHYSPKVDIILVSVGVLDYFLVWWRVGQTGNLWFLILGILPFLLLPFVPIMLIIGLTRLLTRSTGKIYDWFSRAVKPLVGDLYHVIRRNLGRNPRRSSSIAIIIALGLAFGTFTLSTLATQDAHAVREIQASVGADMAAFPFTDEDLNSNLTAIPGVVAVSPVIAYRYVRPGFTFGASVWGLDPDSYFAVAQPESWFFSDGNPSGAHEILSTPGLVLVSQAYYDQAFLGVGDTLQLQTDVYDDNGTFVESIVVDVEVAGVVRSLPGMDFGYTGSVFASLETLAPFQAVSGGPFNRLESKYLIDLDPVADWRIVKAAVLEDPGVSFVTVAAEMIETASANPFTRALYQFISMETVFIGVILTAGVGLILYAASLERDVEFAAIIARGSSGWQTAKLLVGEACVIMLVGLVIGVSVGVGSAFFATQFLNLGPPGTPAPAVPFFFVFPLNAVLLVLLGPAAIVLSAIVVSARTARLNVAKVLKLRGG